MGKTDFTSYATVAETDQHWLETPDRLDRYQSVAPDQWARKTEVKNSRDIQLTRPTKQSLSSSEKER